MNELQSWQYRYTASFRSDRCFTFLGLDIISFFCESLSYSCIISCNKLTHSCCCKQTNILHIATGLGLTSQMLEWLWKDLNMKHAVYYLLWTGVVLLNDCILVLSQEG